MSDIQTLRDTFAAAALTGLLAGRLDRVEESQADAWANMAGLFADAMLRERAVSLHGENAAISEKPLCHGAPHTRERLRSGAPDGRENVTDHDAEPAARAEVAPGTGHTTREPVAWGVLPGDGLPIWACSSCEQAQAVVVWLRKQRPGTDPQVVPLVDGRDPAPQHTITDAEREALGWSIKECEREAVNERSRAATGNYLDCPLRERQAMSRAATLRNLLARRGGGR